MARRVLRTLALAALVTRPLGAQGSATDTTSSDSTRVRGLERVVVTAIRAGEQAPIAQTTLRRAELRARDFGQDVPMLFQGRVPSLISHTETGTNSGYSYVRLRGIDQTRINITLDGVPLNDMEDQVLYFANLGGLLASVGSVQVQRGVGTSTAGTAAFGGSVNLETIPLAVQGASTDMSVQAGSFGARRVSATYRSGLLPNRLAVAATLNAQQTDGYRYNAGVQQRSGFLSAGWFGDRDVVKLTAIAGVLRDTLAYVGATREQLAADRRVNPLTAEDRDRFGQQLVALSYTRAVGVDGSVSTTLYRNSTGGSYDYYAAPDVYNYGLHYAWYGVTSVLHRQIGAVTTDVGVNANTYARRHRSWLGRDRRELYYDNTGHKQDASAFAKVSIDAGRARWFGDLQLRHARFRYEPDANAGIGEHSIDWTFVNPKAGVTVALSPRVSAFASVGRTTREPARNDMLAGADNMDSTNVGELWNLARVKPESVNDLETGVTVTGARGALTANVFAMEFRNNILPIGLPSISGSALRRNVGRSWRRGVEADGTFRPSARVELGAVAAFTASRIVGYTDSSLATPTRYTNVEPILTPRFTTAQRASVTVSRALTLGVEGRYQSRAQLDNTGDRALVLPDFYVLDATARLVAGRWGLTVRGVNLGDSKRFGSGYADEGVPYFFVLPPRAVYVTAEVRF
jgi:iron complex outermembrane receptor protein